MEQEQNVYTGKVINGVIVLGEEVSLPEGATVQVSVIENQDQARESGAEQQPAPQAASRLGAMLLRHAGAITDADLPADLAENLDHYLYGAPKRP